MGNVARIGDPISCGDVCAAGSPNVFAGGMPVTTSGTVPTTGHGCFPPTVLSGGWSSTVFVNGNQVALVGITAIAPHKCGKAVHGGTIAAGAATVSIEA